MERIFHFTFLIALLIKANLLFAGADYSRPICTSLYRAIGPSIENASITERQAVQNLLNNKLSEKFPDLKIILKDPDEFIATMENRFNAQKLLTPENPYLFDYTEVALPVFKKMDKGIADRLEELKAIQEKLKTEGIFSSLKKKYPEDELKTSIKYLEELKQEISAKISAGKVNYKDTVELSYFYGPVMGHFDTREMSFLNRTMLKLDRHIEGHKQMPIETEYNAFKNRDFHLFQEGQVSGSSGYVAAQDPFTDAFKDKNKLQTLIVPNDDQLDCDIFMRLMSREKINIVGVTPKPIMADGFLRPSHDFWIHDLRHESAKFHKKKLYLENNKITPENEKKVNDQLDQWYVELDHAVAKIKDPNLKDAIDMLIFNFYHDRGYPIAPSSFINADLNNVHFGLLGLLKLSKTGVTFKNPISNLKAAEKWLKEYWIEKIPEEERFLKEVSH
jgi:hypothetical protein